jgi:hypothetical protein
MSGRRAAAVVSCLVETVEISVLGRGAAFRFTGRWAAVSRVEATKKTLTRITYCY